MLHFNTGMKYTNVFTHISMFKMYKSIDEKAISVAEKGNELGCTFEKPLEDFIGEKPSFIENTVL